MLLEKSKKKRIVSESSLILIFLKLNAVTISANIVKFKNYTRNTKVVREVSQENGIILIVAGWQMNKE